MFMGPGSLRKDRGRSKFRREPRDSTNRDSTHPGRASSSSRHIFRQSLKRGPVPRCACTTSGTAVGTGRGTVRWAGGPTNLVTHGGGRRGRGWRKEGAEVGRGRGPFYTPAACREDSALCVSPVSRFRPRHPRVRWSSVK